MKNLLYIILISLLLFGCTKYIEFDSETKRSKIVVNGFVQNNEPASVHISRSLSIIDDASLIVIDNAEVKLYNGAGDFLELLHLFGDTINVTENYGLYQGDLFLDENDEYKIEVSVPSYESVSSKTKIPKYNLVQTSPLDTLSSSNSEFGESITNFTFHFSDNGNEENYYGIKAYGLNQFESESIEIWITTEDVSVDVNWGNEILFTDNFFNGSSYDLNLKLSTIYYGPPISDSLIIGNIKFDSIRFEMNSYSRDMFLYRKSYQAYQSVNEFFSQPVQVYSNIENGLGVFGGIKEETFTIAIE